MVLRPDEDTRPIDESQYGTTTDRLIMTYLFPAPQVLDLSQLLGPSFGPGTERVADPGWRRHADRLAIAIRRADTERLTCPVSGAFCNSVGRWPPPEHGLCRRALTERAAAFSLSALAGTRSVDASVSVTAPRNFPNAARTSSKAR